MLLLLSVLLSWSVALLSWLPAGYGTLKLLSINRHERPLRQLMIACISGAAIHTSLLAVASLFMPITTVVSIVVASVLILLFRDAFKQGLYDLVNGFDHWSRYAWLALPVLVFVSVGVSLLPTLNNDSGLYYIQFMRWINDHAAVPGLANLHERFGFNSNWHLAQAAFNMEVFGLPATNDLNALLFLLFGAAGLEAALHLNERPTLADALWATMPICLFVLLRFLTSTAPDLPATLIPMAYLAYLTAERKQASLPLMVLLIAFASTIKLLSFLHIIVVLPLFFNDLGNRNWNAIRNAVLLGLLVSVPWMARNVIISGYVVFPLESIDLFSVDWKVPAQLSANARKMVDTHARMGTYDLSTYGSPLHKWFPVWISVQSKTVLGIFAVAVLGGLSTWCLALVQMLKTRARSGVVLFSLTTSLFASLAFWWVSGPNPRFVYGIVLFFFSYTLADAFLKLHLANWLRLIPVVALLLLIMMYRTVSKESPPIRPTTFGIIGKDDRPVFYPIGSDKCWDHPLPCTNTPDRMLEWRGKDLQHGFRTRGTH